MAALEGSALSKSLHYKLQGGRLNIALSSCLGHRLMKCPSCVRVRNDLITALFLESRKEAKEESNKSGLAPVGGGRPLEDF